MRGDQCPENTESALPKLGTELANIDSGAFEKDLFLIILVI